MVRQVRVEEQENPTNLACHSCGRSFARKEHLIRHRRTHTHEKPFQCAHCQAQFSRHDVREKHRKRCKASGLSAENEHRQSATGPTRCTRACNPCRQRKVKCDGQYPCGACQKASVTCNTIPITASQARHAPDRALIYQSTAISSIAPVVEQVSSDMQTSPESDDPFERPTVVDIPDNIRYVSDIEPASVQALSSSSARLMAPHTVEAPTEDHFLGHEQVPASAALYHDTQSNAYPSVGVYDWNFLETDVDLTGIFPQLFELDYDTWIQGFDDVVSQALPHSETPASMSGAITMMKDHFHRKSLTGSTLTRTSQHTWFSVPPDLQMYDRDMINVLLNLTEKHLANTFPLFMPFEFSGGADEELAVAMAAVGALFCDVEGSHKVAKACYNDARRITLAKTLSNPHVSTDMLVNRAKTFILLEIYGLCSGDARSFEFVEAFHGFLLQTVRRFRQLISHASVSETRDSEMKLLIDAIQLLECYRVNIIQRPLTLTTFMYSPPRAHGESETQSDHPLTSLSDGLNLHMRRTEDTSSLTRLAMIAKFVWFPGSHGPFGWREPYLWRTEFVELAMRSWNDSQTGDMDPWTSVLYHMAHINLHSNIPLLRCHARLVAKTGHIPSQPEEVASIERWLTGRHYAISAWHAQTLLEIVQTKMGAKYWTFDRLRSVDYTASSHDCLSEPPHLSFAVYYASLILWYGGFTPSRSRVSHNSHIEAGASMLLHLRVHIAKNLSNALYELLT